MEDDTEKAMDHSSRQPEDDPPPPSNHKFSHITVDAYRGW